MVPDPGMGSLTQNFAGGSALRALLVKDKRRGAEPVSCGVPASAARGLFVPRPRQAKCRTMAPLYL